MDARIKSGHDEGEAGHDNVECATGLILGMIILRKFAANCAAIRNGAVTAAMA